MAEERLKKLEGPPLEDNDPNWLRKVMRKIEQEGAERKNQPTPEPARENE